MNEKYAAYRRAVKAEAEAHVRLARAQEHGTAEEVIEAVIEAKSASIEADVRYRAWKCEDS